MPNDGTVNAPNPTGASTGGQVTSTATTGANSQQAPASGGADQPRDAAGRFEVKPDEYRFPADWPVEWQRGRTAAEVGNLGNQLYQQSVMGGGQPHQQGYQQQPFGGGGYQQPQYAVPPQGYALGYSPAPPQPQPPTAEEWQLDPATAYQKAMTYQRQTEFEPVIQQQQTALAQTARELAKLRYTDEFRRWGPEIDLMLNQVPAHQRTAQAYEWVVDMVRGKHTDDLAKEKAEALIAQRIQAGEVIRPQAGALQGGSAPVDGRIDLESDKVPAWFKDRCARKGIKPGDIDSFLMTTKLYGDDLDQARKRYLAALERDGAVAEASK